MKKLSIFLVATFTVMVFSLPLVSRAQGGPDLPPDNEDDDTPFDGGVSVLIATAVAYGIYKIKQGDSVAITE